MITYYIFIGAWANAILEWSRDQSIGIVGTRFEEELLHQIQLKDDYLIAQNSIENILDSILSKFRLFQKKECSGAFKLILVFHAANEVNFEIVKKIEFLLEKQDVPTELLAVLPFTYEGKKSVDRAEKVRINLLDKQNVSFLDPKNFNLNDKSTVNDSFEALYNAFAEFAEARKKVKSSH